MPIIQLENAILEDRSRDEQSSASSAMSNLLDSIKLSSKFRPKPEIISSHRNQIVVQKGTNNDSPQPLFPHRTNGSPLPGNLHKNGKTMMNFTSITESLSASSEDISEAIGKTFGLFNASSFLKEPSEIALSESSDVHNFYNTSSNWAALAVPAGFRQSRSAEDYSTKQQQRTIPPVWSFENPSKEKDLTRSERTRNILKDIATKTFETETVRNSFVDSEFATSWGDEETSDLRDISIMDNDSLTEVEESVFEDEEYDSEDDDSIDTFQTIDTEHDDNFVFGGDQEGLRALGSVLYQLGTCTFDINATADDASRGRSRSPRTPPAPRMAGHPGLETVQSYLGFSEERELRRLHGGAGNDNRKARGGDGILSAMFSCGSPMP
ncbi:hypothetical protein MPSEU_000529900 [Mayamaea pseudoterrestris]|nr:hypothetical protein MPSEU_000529900 [Mayamaea pseudoterrestris]